MLYMSKQPRLKWSNLIVPLIAILLLPLLIHGQRKQDQITVGYEVSIKSGFLVENRTLLIHLPTNYEKSKRRFPVMILLDGDAHFLHVSGLVEFQARIGRMPQMIVVGIRNTNRIRDFTPPPAAADASRYSSSGGADKFLMFIEGEVLPYIDKKYRTEPFRVLVGHSFGGLFTIHAFVKKPTVFGGYIAVSPSLWWNDKQTVLDAERMLKTTPRLNKSVYLSYGTESDETLQAGRYFAQIMENNSPDKFNYMMTQLPRESHRSIPHRAIHLGLELIYRDWRLSNFTELLEEQGIAGVDEHYKNLTEQFEYDIPTPQWAVNRAGYWKLNRGEAESAIALFERNVKEHPKSANAYGSLGDGYKAVSDSKKALKYYKKAVALAKKSNSPNLLNYIGKYELLSLAMEEQ